jgi:hypothetical protein
LLYCRRSLDAGDRFGQRVQRAALAVLDRQSRDAGLGGHGDVRSDAGGGVREAGFEVSVDGKIGRRADGPDVLHNVSSRESVRSLRPMDAERPALVVAIAPKPSFSSWRISPTLQAFGMTKDSECIDLKRWRADFRSFMAKSSRLGLIALTRRHPATSRGVSWEWYR